MFHDRTYAAFLLEEPLHAYKNTSSIILAIPRGGVPVGYHLSRLLNLPLSIALSKKIGHPENEEFAIGSVTMDDVIIDETHQDVSKKYIAEKTKELKEELSARYKRFMEGIPEPDLSGKNVILVDDGIATGNTVLACVKSIRKKNPRKIIVAVPVSSTHAQKVLTPVVDEFISLIVPPWFHAVGEFYENFDPVEDDEVKRLLSKAQKAKIMT